MLVIPNVIRLTSAAAIITPKRISGNARRSGMPKTNETRVAVHAPVKGKGIATNSTKAKSWNSSNDLSCFFLVRKNNQAKNLSKKEKRRESSPLTIPNSGKRSTGTIFPATEKKNACHKGKWYISKAIGIDPRNSMIGDIAMKNVCSSNILLSYGFLRIKKRAHFLQRAHDFPLRYTGAPIFPPIDSPSNGTSLINRMTLSISEKGSTMRVLPFS